MSGIVTPDDTDIEHVDVVVCQSVHATVVVAVVPVRDDHAGDIVGVLRLDSIVHAVVVHIEGRLLCARLDRILVEPGYKVDAARQIVSVPERNDQPDKTDDDQNPVEPHEASGTRTLNVK